MSAETGYAYSPPGAAAEGWRLRRRGVDHGTVARLAEPRPPADAFARWDAGRPIHLPGLLGATLAEVPESCEATLRMFARLRDGARFLDELDARLADDDLFRYSSSTVDHHDAREVEKVFVDAWGDGRRVARDLSAKLSWIADDARDRSMRIRFSFGHEATADWLVDDGRAEWAERFAERVFPECEIVSGDPDLGPLVADLCGRPCRFGERIVFCNAPGGGARFHEDADPDQLGVVFAQLAGETAWLALPAPELAAHLAAHGAGEGPAELLAALRGGDRELPAELRRTLDDDPRFTARLCAAGALHLLEPGDALLLPSPARDRCCWHSVFAAGAAPSLGHSYGVYGAG